MKILADENIPLVHAFFDSLGEVVTRPGRQMQNADLQGAGALLVRSVTQVNRQLLEGSPLDFVGTCTIGVDHLDQAYFGEAGITWASAPGCNANSVVEYVYAALCALDVNWLNARVGIIGCGNVGGLLHKRLRAQGVDCACYDPFLTPEQNPDLTSLQAVLACDIICLHTPLTQSGPHPSYHLLGESELRQLREGAVLLNAGRGPVIDNQALGRVLKDRPDLRVVLDVWEPEPDISLALLEQVALGSPHIAGYSYDGKLKGTEMIYQALCRHLGISPSLTLRDLVPPLADNQLLCPPGDDWQSIKALIAQVYDINADDLALRQLAAKGTEGFGQGFDGLRKHYPIRREFHNYQVAAAAGHNLSPRLKTWLGHLGFGVAGEA